MTAAPRVVHVVESLDRGAVEKWLLRMLGHARETGVAVDWTFYCMLPNPGRCEQVALDLGAKVLRSQVPWRQLRAFSRHLREAMRVERPDVLHCHHDVMSGLYLLATEGLGIRRRLVHVHNADLHIPVASPARACVVRAVLRRYTLLRAGATIGISRHTLEDFVGRADQSPRRRVHYYGVKERTAMPAQAESLRTRLGAGASSRLLLFIGRFADHKNPLAIIDILAELRKRRSDVSAVFVGSGPLREEIAARAAASGVGSHVTILGWMDDVTPVLEAADVLVFARKSATSEIGPEGLGLTIVEAQASGLPIVMSDAVPGDAIIVQDSVDIVPAGAPVKTWADRVEAMLAKPRPGLANGTRALQQSPFDMDRALRDLISLHEA